MSTKEYYGKLFACEKAADTERVWRFGILKRIYPFCLICFDVLLIGILFVAAIFVRHGEIAVASLNPFVLSATIGGLIFGVFLIGGYSYRTATCTARFVSEHIVVSLISSAIVITIVYAFISFGTGIAAARSAVFPTLVMFPLCSIGYRYHLSRVKSRRQMGKAICIVGSTKESLHLVRMIREFGLKQEIFVFDDFREDGVYDEMSMMPIQWASLNTFDPESNVVGEKLIEHVILAVPPEDLSPRLTIKLMRSHSMRNHVVMLETYVLREFKQVPTHLVTPSWLFSDGFRINSSLAYNRAKRVIDFTACSIGLLVISPVLVLTALAVKLTSRGSVLYSQERIGRHEKPFKLYKFRTMVEGADLKGDYTEDNDSRITPIGRFLRKTRIDELPQFFNVLKGDMSLIGPRPEWSKLVERYEAEVELYHFRHLVRPGITGWAQVNYSYGASLEDAVRKLNYDLYYVRYFSLLQDVTIIVKTIYTMAFGRGR